MEFNHPHFGIKIDTNDLEISNKIFKLKKIFERFPKTICKCCPNKNGVESDCCKVFSPPMYLIEFIAMLKEMYKDISKIDIKQLVKRSIDTFLFYDESCVLKKPCPLLIDNKCLLYEERPFSCRNFGLYSKSEWERRLKAIKNETGLIDNEIPFSKQCEGVDICKGQLDLHITPERSNIMFDEIRNLDIQLFGNINESIGNITYMPFDHHLLVLFLGPDLLEQLTDMKLLLIKKNKEKIDKIITEEEYCCFKKSVTDFSDVLKEMI